MKTEPQLFEHESFAPANDNEPPPMRPPVFDAALFKDDLTDCGMTEEHRLQFLRILFDMMVSFADLGFGIEPTQAICGQLIKNAFEESIDSPDAIEWNQISEKETLRNRFGNTSGSGKAKGDSECP